MRPTFTTPAVVLRSWPYGESDKIVCLLTEKHGKITGIARGAKRSRKRFANSLEPISLVNLRFQDRPHGALAFILAADLAFAYKSLAGSLEKITLASYLVEITDGLTGERDESALIFNHLRQGLRFIDSAATTLAEFLIWFELKLLRLAGYQPALDSCRRCAGVQRAQHRVSWYFSPGEGGILCQLCGQARPEVLPLGEGALAALKKLQEEDSAGEAYGHDSTLSLSLPDLRESRVVIQRYLQFHIEREIKSAAFLAKFVTL
jgi:DNA repair protein RecO (recombination protein O)